VEAESSLAKLEIEREELAAEAERRVRVGARLDDYSQSLLDSYLYRRGQLWNQLAAIEQERTHHNRNIYEGKVLFGMHQFDDVKTDTTPEIGIDLDSSTMRGEDAERYGRSSSEIGLDLQMEQIEARPKVLEPALPPFLVQNTVQDIFPGINTQAHATDADTWFDSVCAWLLKCAESSWLSYLRFFGKVLEEGSTIDHDHLKTYIASRKPGALFVPARHPTACPASINSSVLPSHSSITDLPAPKSLKTRSLHPQQFTMFWEVVLAQSRADRATRSRAITQ